MSTNGAKSRGSAATAARQKRLRALQSAGHLAYLGYDQGRRVFAFRIGEDRYEVDAARIDAWLDGRFNPDHAIVSDSLGAPLPPPVGATVFPLSGKLTRHEAAEVFGLSVPALAQRLSRSQASQLMPGPGLDSPVPYPAAIWHAWGHANGLLGEDGTVLRASGPHG